MSDNVITNPGSGGAVFRSKDVGSGVQVPVIIPATSDGTLIDATNPMPVSLAATQIATLTPLSSIAVNNLPSSQAVTGTFWQATQPVSMTSLPALAAGANAIGSVTVSNFPATQAISATALPLPTGAATDATLSTLSGKIPSGLTVTSTRLLVDASGTTQPISAASLPLPALAATSTKQSDGTQKTQIVDGSGNVAGTTASGTTIGVNTQLTGITFTLSTLNSSSTQLASGTTYAGTIEATFNQPAAQIIVVCDQPYTVYLDQFDGANNLISTDTFSRAANVPTNENVQVNGDSCRVRVLNNGARTTTTLRIETTYGPLPPLPRANTSLGNLKTALNELNGTVVSVGTGSSDQGTQRVAVSTDSTIAARDSDVIQLLGLLIGEVRYTNLLLQTISGINLGDVSVNKTDLISTLN